MGVYLTDRTTGQVFGLKNRLFDFAGQVLHALGGEAVPTAWTRDGYVPSWLAHRWGALLFNDLGEAVVVSRPDPSRGPGLHPVGVYRRGDPSAAHWALQGEQLSVYDTEAATGLLGLAQFLSATTGVTVTTMRPPAPATPVSEVAARWWLHRSRVLPPRGVPVRPPRSRR